MNFTASRDVGDCEWERLTSLPAKKSWFSVDPHFRFALNQFRGAFGIDLYDVTDSIAVLYIQPDGIAARRVEGVCKFLNENGFSLMHAKVARHTYHSVREEWRYQFNEMTVDRMAITDWKYRAGGVLHLVLKDEESKTGLPASVRLQRLKGSSSPLRRKAGQLRIAIRSPNGLLKLIHAPDEPADVLRELATFLAPIELSDLLRDLSERDLRPLDWGSIEAISDRLCASAYQHDLDVGSSQDRVGKVLNSLPSDSRIAIEVRRFWNDALDDSAQLPWIRFSDCLASLGIDVDWDWVVACSDLVLAKYDDIPSLIDCDGTVGWPQ